MSPGKEIIKTHRCPRNRVDDKLEASHVRCELQFASLPNRPNVRDVPHVKREQLLREKAPQGGEGGRLRQRAAAAAAVNERGAESSDRCVEETTWPRRCTGEQVKW